ncbi:MAG TPA: hypothetical protein VHB48_16025 [Chitinophagaceae bacterium]|nr:hypothetical protein [Chitinophagaceae bacterium]
MFKQALWAGTILLVLGCRITTVNINVVYAVINGVILDDSIFAPNVCAKFWTPKIPDSIIQKYLNGDKQFVHEQLCVSRGSILDTGRVFFYWKKKHTITKSSIDQNCAGYNEIEITYPVFSKDLKTAVIGFNSVDGGFIAVCILTNKKWTLVRKYYSWIY